MDGECGGDNCLPARSCVHSLQPTMAMDVPSMHYKVLKPMQKYTDTDLLRMYDTVLLTHRHWSYTGLPHSVAC